MITSSATVMTSQTPAPMTPESNPTPAARFTPIGCGSVCWRRWAARAPPATIQRQQQLATLRIGRADRTPMNKPPRNAGWSIVSASADQPQRKRRVRGRYRTAAARVSVVILAAEVRDQLLAHHVPQRVLQFHQLNEQ